MTIPIYQRGNGSSGPLPKTGAIRSNEGSSVGYFRHHHASQADIPHVVTDNNRINSMYALSSYSIKHLHYTSWREEIYFFFS
jgi:hypothetical protein